LDRPQLDPEPRAVDFLAEEEQQHEEHEGCEHPQVFVRGETPELRERRTAGDREQQRNDEPPLLALREIGRETRDQQQTQP
jgi:hypothetical protein